MVRDEETGKVTLTKRDKIVTKIIHRLISEESTKLVTLSGKISVLNHQAENFKDMHECTQNTVLEEIFSLMNQNGWQDWAKEVKEELDVNVLLDETGSENE